MGFRNLAEFNQALLAKQGWRILTNTYALWVKVQQIHYFPCHSFLDARTGSFPSWLWSSLLYGRDLLKSNLLWQVGNGHDISIWNTTSTFGEVWYLHSSLRSCSS